MLFVNNNDQNRSCMIEQIKKYTSNIGWVSATVSFIWPTTIVSAAYKISQAVAVATALSLINVAFIQTATAGVCSWMNKTTR